MHNDLKDIGTLSIVRHGETEWNAAGIVMGQKDSPLTDIGEEQARRVGEKLRDVPFSAVYSSDLGRTLSTAELIKGEREIPLIPCEMLREQYYGSFEGGSADDLFPRWEDLPDDIRWTRVFSEDMESHEEAVRRFTDTLLEIARAHPGKNVLVVTHGALLHYFLIKLGSATWKTLEKVENGAIITVESDGREFVLKTMEGVKLRDAE